MKKTTQGIEQRTRGRGTGGGGQDLLIAGAGDDHILGDADWVASSFNWTVSPSNVFYPVTGDPTPNDAAADVIYAGKGNDLVWAGQGNDAVFGEDGDDYLSGNGGNDIILGGAGKDSDVLIGGSGVDTYVWQAGSTAGIDIIIDKDNTGYLRDDTSSPIVITGGDQYGDNKVFRGKDANGVNHLYTFVTGDRALGGDLLVDNAANDLEWRMQA